MARIFKCDRCGTIDENNSQGYGVITYLSDTMELCEKCIEDVWSYASPKDDKTQDQ